MYDTRHLHTQIMHNNTYQVDVHEWRQHLLTFEALHAELQLFEQRAASLHDTLQQRLVAHHAALQQHTQLHSTRQRTDAHRQRAADLQRQLEECHRRLHTTHAVVHDQAQALLRGGRHLQDAQARLGAARRELARSGVAQWHAVRNQLVARRCAMVATLADVFCIGPKIVSEAPPGGYLDEKMDRRWWAGVGGAPSDDEDTSSLDHASASSPRPSSSGGARQVAKMVVCELELPTSLGRRPHPDDIALARGQWEAAHTAAALGYVAQCVERLGAYLGVVTRYPLELLGSRSVVRDAPPPTARRGEGVASHAEGEGPSHALLATSQVWEVRSEPWLTSGGSEAYGQGPDDLPVASNGGSVREPARLPLFFDGVELTRFAYGTFLLSKNIEQLLVAHGLSPVGSTQLLHNLHKLLMLAKSATGSARSRCD